MAFGKEGDVLMEHYDLVQIVITRPPNGSWRISLFSEDECVENFEIMDKERVSRIVRRTLERLRAPCKAGGTAR